MKQIKLRVRIFSIIALLLCYVPLQATSVTTTTTLMGIQLTITYDNVVCLGSYNTITFTLENTNDTPWSSQINVLGFSPNATATPSAGLTFTSAQPPPIVGVFFDPTAMVANPCSTDCPNPSAAGQGWGNWQPSNTGGMPSFPNSIPDTFTITYQATACGIWSYVGQLELSTGLSGCSCFPTITIDVIPYATLIDLEYFCCLCNNSTSGITGFLPTPECPSNSGCTGPLGPCPMVPCENCSGVVAPYPFNFTGITGVIGGTVALLNPTSGLFQFIPSPTFQGTGSFIYNVISETTPPQFCPPVTGGTVIIPIVQSPLATPATFTGCGNTSITGYLPPYVTGGSGNYSFTGGPASCGTLSLSPSGFFTFSAPTGPNTCDFFYQATDVVYGCTGSGEVTINVLPTPTATPQTVGTCVNAPVSGTLMATGGSGTYASFAIIGTIPSPCTVPPCATANGMITSFDPTTGDFTYTPNTGFTGTDSFMFTVMDSNGCTSLPATVTIMVNPIPMTSSTAIAGCENTTVTGSLVPLVSGGTGPQVFSLTGPQPSCGGVLIFASGNFQFAPNFGFTGPCSFNYQVVQGGCIGSGPNTVTVNVGPAPVVTGAIFNVCPFGNVTGDLNNYLISSSGTTTFFQTGPTINGNLTLNPSGPFSFTATISSGTAGFDFEAMSSAFSCPSSPAMITVNVHPNPTTVTGTIADCAGQGAMGNLNPNVSGTPPYFFTGPTTPPVNGIVTVDANGSFTFTGTIPGVTGSFTYEVSDFYGCMGTGTELITVNPSPTAMNQTATGCSNSEATGSLSGAVSGGSPGGYVFSLVPPVVGGVATVSSAGNYTFTPNPGATAGSFNFEASDSRGCAAEATVTVTINQAPSGMTGYFTGCDNGFTGSLVPLVTGGTPPYTFTGPIGPVENGSVIITSAGNFFFDPSGIGPASFNFDVTDSAMPPCMSNIIPVEIEIETGPIASPATYDDCENTPLMVSAASGLANYVSNGMPPYMFFETGPFPTCGTLLIGTGDGSFNYIPTPGFTGDCTFNWYVQDSVPCTSNVSTVTIDVHPNPMAESPAPIPWCEFDPYTGNLNSYMTGGTPPYTGFTGGLPINGTINYLLPSGPFEFTPSGVGFASFEYSGFDSFGCHSNTGTISFTAYESPVIFSPSPLDVCSNSSVTSFATATGSDGPFTFTIVATTNGTAVIDSMTGTSAIFTFTPDVTSICCAPAFPTPIVIGTVTIRATAALGSSPTMQPCYDQTTVTIYIHQAPVINITGINSCTGNFTGSLAPFVTGGVPSYRFGPAGLVPTSPTGCGSVVLDIFGNFTFSSTGLPCPCSFNFNVTDSSTGSASGCTSTGTVSVCVNQPPFANNLTTCQCANVPYTILLEALVTGGKPPFTFTIVGTPVGGTVLLLNPTTGLVVFVPTPGFSGFASFQYQVTDSNVPACISNVGTVTIQVPCCPPTSITTVT